MYLIGSMRPAEPPVPARSGLVRVGGPPGRRVGAERATVKAGGQAVEQAGDQPVEITVPQTNTTHVLLKADVYSRMRGLVDSEEDRRERDAWSKLGRRARSECAKENAY